MANSPFQSVQFSGFYYSHKIHSFLLPPHASEITEKEEIHRDKENAT